MAKAKAKRKGKKGKQAKLSKRKKKGGAKRIAATRRGGKKKKSAKRKAAPRARVTRSEPAPIPAAFTEIAPEEITPSMPETPEEPVMGSTEQMGTGDSGFTSTDDSSNTSM
jgi:hypothetical protein